MMLKIIFLFTLFLLNIYHSNGNASNIIDEYYEQCSEYITKKLNFYF